MLKDNRKASNYVDTWLDYMNRWDFEFNGIIAVRKNGSDTKSNRLSKANKNNDVFTKTRNVN